MCFHEKEEDVVNAATLGLPMSFIKWEGKFCVVIKQ